MISFILTVFLLFLLFCEFLVACFLMFRVDLFICLYVTVVEIHTLILDVCVCLKQKGFKFFFFFFFYQNSL